MPIYKGSTKLGTVYHDGTKIGNVYKGSTLVYNLKKNIDMYKLGNYSNYTVYCAGYPKPNFKLMTVWTIYKGTGSDLGPFETVTNITGNIGQANSSITYTIINSSYTGQYDASLNLTDSYGKTYFAYKYNAFVALIAFALQNTVVGDNVCASEAKYGIVSADGNTITVTFSNDTKANVAITTRTKVDEWVVK